MSWGLLSLAQLVLILDVTVVNVALPAIGAGLHLDRPTLTWVLTAYTLVFGGLVLLGGRLADLADARRLMLTGLAVCTSATCWGKLGAANRSEAVTGARQLGLIPKPAPAAGHGLQCRAP